MKHHQLSWLVVLTLCLVFAQITVRADERLAVISGENVTQIKPLASFVGHILPNQNFNTNEFIATVSNDQIILLNSITAETRTIRKIADMRQLLAVSPNGRHIAYQAKNNYDVVMRNLETGQDVMLIEGDTAEFSADSKRLLVRNSVDTNLMYQWDVTTGEQIYYDSAEGSVLRQASYSPDGTKLLNFTGTAFVLLDVTSGKPLLTTLPVGAPDPGAQYLPNRNVIVIYSDVQIDFWDVDSGTQLSSLRPDDMTWWQEVHISADGTAVSAVVIQTGEIYIWSLDDLRNLGSPYIVPKSALQNNYEQGYETDGKTLVQYGNYDTRLQLTTLATGKSVTIKPAAFVDHVAFSNDGNLLLIGTNSPSPVQVWSWDGTSANKLMDLVGNDFQLNSNGSLLYVSYAPYGAIQLTTIYGIPTAEHPEQPMMMQAKVIPNIINVRSAPESNAPIVGKAGGVVVIQGRDESGMYVYLPDYQGWVRADAAYLKKPDGFQLEQLSVLNPAEVAALAVTPSAIPSLPDLTPSETPSPTITPVIALTSKLASTAVVPAVPEGYTPITLANHDQVRLLGVFNIAAESLSRRSGVAVSPDSSSIFGTSQSNTDLTYNFVDLQHLALLSQINISEHPPILATSLDGHFLVWWNSRGDFRSWTIVIWDATKEKAYFRVFANGDIVGAVINPDADLLAIIRKRHSTEIWGNNGTEYGVLRYTLPSGMTYFSDDGQTIIVLEGSVIRTYEAETGRPLKNISFTPFEHPVAQHFNQDAHSLVMVSDKQIEYVDLENGAAKIVDLSASQGLTSDMRVTFSSDNANILVVDHNNLLCLIDSHTGQSSGTWQLKDNSGAAFSPDGRFIVTSNPLQVINLADGSITALPGHYIGTNIAFSPDATSLIVSDHYTSMVLGIPNAQRPGWQPVIGHVKSSGISVRAIPDHNADTIGYAKGEVKVGGRAIGGSGAVYLPELGGWVWSDQNYLSLDTPFDLLPIISSSPQ